MSDGTPDHKRPKPYIWPSWITALLAGTDHCTWKAWYKSNFRFSKRADGGGFNLAAWTAQHDSMTKTRAEKLRADGWKVRVEAENEFKLVGASADLSGKPDIVAYKEAEKRVLIIDEKSGQAHMSHVWQIFIYKFALLLTRFKTMPWINAANVEGEIEYRAQSRFISPAEYTIETREKISEMLRILGSSDEPKRVPSAGECRFCDIANCPDRYVEQGNPEADASDYF